MKFKYAICFVSLILTLTVSGGFCATSVNTTPVEPGGQNQAQPQIYGPVVTSQTKNSDYLSWAGIALGLVGLVGTIYTVMAYRSAQKDKELYKYLFDAAKNNLNFDITDKKIQQKKKEVEEYTHHILQLQDKIKSQIPIEARKAVLLSKLHTQIDVLTQTYQSVIELRSQLPPDSQKTDIPEEIIKAIEQEISPDYMVEQERKKWKNYITVISTMAAVLSALLPHPIGRWVTVPLFITIIPFVIKLGISHLPPDQMSRKQYLLKFYCFLSGGVSSILFFIGGILIWINETSHYGADNTGAILVFSGLSTISLFCFLMLLLKYQRLSKKIAAATVLEL